MYCRCQKQSGFTLIELMIVVAIIGILAAIAIPSYNYYISKSRYTEMINFSVPYKRAVELCYQERRTLSGCSGGMNGIPAHMLNNSDGLVRHVLILNGRIYVFPNQKSGFTTFGDYFIMQPSTNANTGILTWTYTGPAVTSGYVKN